ncbi:MULTISPECIES: hypothetical protein [Capnocytophaga]|nr:MULTISPECIES: hypothetical protein [Capnocytophaga]ATA73240.1 hypothetical protein CGC49_08105 [Capnocytophaga sp. H4358]ATA75380.1 hypothetical protein CGC52_08115 [Capnocytophaga sp. H2931]RIY38232.1 hypothetical protein CKY20_01420 [Capnocytophaga canis]CEN44075.1 conserved membrane hypothetical protein [Capnocytophaga canis]CEN44450.1 conserved membrane hypothetical protein [Capnocytophaga canis]
MTKYYQPSGKYSPVAFVYFLLVSLFVLPLLGGIYAYATWYIPLVYINVLITIMFGFAIAGVIANLVIKLGKVRNYALGVIFTLLGALVAYYAQWIVWADLALNTTDTIGNNRIGVAISNVNFGELFHLLLNPSDLFSLIAEINSVGTWGVKGSTVNGIFLSIVWVAEIIVIFYAAFLGTKNQAKRPFSEVADKWFKEEKLPLLSYIEDQESFKSDLESGDYERISELTLSDKKQSHSFFVLYALEGVYYVSVINNKAQQDDKGKIKFETKNLIQYMRIDKTAYDALKLRVRA